MSESVLLMRTQDSARLLRLAVVVEFTIERGRGNSFDVLAITVGAGAGSVIAERLSRERAELLMKELIYWLTARTTSVFDVEAWTKRQDDMEGVGAELDARRGRGGAVVELAAIRTRARRSTRKRPAGKR